MKKLFIAIVAAMMAVPALRAQEEAPQVIQGLSLDYNLNTLYPKDDSSTSLNGFGVNYNFDYRITESLPIYIGTGLNFQFLFRNAKMIEVTTNYGDAELQDFAIRDKVNMYYMDVPVNISYRARISPSAYLTPMLGLDFKVQLYGHAKIDVSGAYSSEIGEFLNEYVGVQPGKSFNLYDNGDMMGNAWHRFQFGWHAGLKLNYKDYFISMTYGTDFVKLQRNLGQGTFQIALGMNF